MATRKLKACAIECREHLEAAYKIATEEANNAGWITAWAMGKEEFEDYSYTVELEEEIDSLREKLGRLPDSLPQIVNAMDAVKLEFFFENFAKIPLAALEWVVAEVENKKIVV